MNWGYFLQAKSCTTCFRDTDFRIFSLEFYYNPYYLIRNVPLQVSWAWRRCHPFYKTRKIYTLYSPHICLIIIYMLLCCNANKMNLLKYLIIVVLYENLTFLIIIILSLLHNLHRCQTCGYKFHQRCAGTVPAFCDRAVVGWVVWSPLTLIS